jgi:hypothetical protein
LRGINWDDFDLKAVNKDVYKEHASVKSRDINEVKQWLKENEIKLKGDNIPTPIFKIEEANFPGYISRSQ